MALVLILTYLEDCPQAKSTALAEGEANLEQRLAAVTHREARAAQAMQETSLICHQAKEELEGALQHVNQIGAELQATKRHHAKACPLALRCCQSLTSLVLQLFPHTASALPVCVIHTLKSSGRNLQETEELKASNAKIVAELLTERKAACQEKAALQQRLTAAIQELHYPHAANVQPTLPELPWVRACCCNAWDLSIFGRLVIGMTQYCVREYSQSLSPLSGAQPSCSCQDCC